MKKIFAALAVLFIASTAAQAASVTFDFSSGTTNWTGGNLNYSSGGLNLAVKAGNYSRKYAPSGFVYDTGVIRQNDGQGLSIWNGWGDSNSQIDGYTQNDVAVFSFSENVYLESVTLDFTTHDYRGRKVYNGDKNPFAFFSDTDDNNYLDLVASSLATDQKTGTYKFMNAMLKNGDLFGIGAMGNNDNFTIASITVGTISAVPLPAALPLYGAGVAIIGFIGWCRKRKHANL